MNELSTECLSRVSLLTTQVGEIQIAATDAGICALRFPGQVLLQNSEDSLPLPALSTLRENHMQQATRWLRAYFENRPLPQAPPLDLRWCSDFGRRVYNTLVQVPVGDVITYGELAFAIGAPGAARAVGSWMRKNRIPVIIPCHRVVTGSGAIGGWSGPDGMKRWLLDFERKKHK